MVVNNKNTSPAKNKLNELKNKGLILDTKGISDFTLVDNVLKLLQDNKLINDWDFDRTDNNTDTEHNHYYFNSSVNNNSLNGIINKAIQGKDIQKELSALIAQKREDMTYTLKGTLDKSSSSINLTEDLKNDLITKTDDFRIFTISETGQSVTKNFTESLGLGGAAKPINILNGEDSGKLNGSFSFDFHLDKEIDPEAKAELLANAENSFKFTFGRYVDFDFSKNNFDFNVVDNQISVSFNNIFDSKVGPEIYMISKKNIKKDMEVFLKELDKNSSMDLKFESMRYTKDVESLKKMKAQTVQPVKAPVTIPSLQASAGTTQQQAVVNKLELEPSFFNMVFKTPLAKLNLLARSFGDLIVHLEEVRSVLGDEVTNQKIEELKEKVLFVEKREMELKEKEELEEITTKINAANELLNLEVKNLNGVVEATTIERDTFKIDLEKANKDLEDSKTLLQKSETQLVDTQAELTNVLGENGTLKESLNEISQKFKDTRTELNGTRTELNGAKIFIKNIENSNDTLEKELKEARAKIAELEKASLEKEAPAGEKHLSARDKARLYQEERKEKKDNANNHNNNNDNIDGLK